MRDFIFVFKTKNLNTKLNTLNKFQNFSPNILNKFCIISQNFNFREVNLPLRNIKNTKIQHKKLRSDYDTEISFFHLFFLITKVTYSFAYPVQKISRRPNTQIKHSLINYMPLEHISSQT